MYLFSRISTVAPGRLRSAEGFIADVTAHVNENTPFDVSVWGFQFGRPVGTVGWSMMVESQAEFLEASAELNASTTYVDKVNSAADLFTGPAEDFLRQVVHQAGEAPESFDFAVATTAVIAEDFSKAVQWAVEMTDLANAITGQAVMLGTDVYGDFGGLLWLGGLADAAAVEASDQAMRGNEDYLAKLDDAEDYFVPGHSRRALLRRLM